MSWVDRRDEMTQPINPLVLKFVAETVTNRVMPTTLRPILWRRVLCDAADIDACRGAIAKTLKAKNQV